ncbi:MAG: hypothetical protein LBK58_07250 [Prevotellaceae bacterium]|jgi:hypothetical protein|nr:hypothetical protein [Prevotellaceae bacterium]
MILITSAAYVTAGLVAELGQLPPCMLPVQNRRLYSHQLSLIPEGEKIVLSLPSDFQIDIYDRKQLDDRSVDIVFVPRGLKLGESIVYVLNVTSCYDEPLNILHGDTLLAELPKIRDCYSVAKAEDDYAWAYIEDEKQEKNVYAGFFSFSSQSLLIRKITENNYDFMKGVEDYNSVKKLEKIPALQWFDFGLANSYYRSKSRLTTQRVFNDLQINYYSVRKSSRDFRKILAEANWFLSIPAKLKRFTPAIWDYGMDGEQGFYEMEYFYLNSLAELYVFGKNPLFVWKNIFRVCADFIYSLSQFCPANSGEIALQNIKLFGEKTRERLCCYSNRRGISLEKAWIVNNHEVPSISEIVSETNRYLNIPKENFAHIMHGDFCFSNILYDFKSQSIRTLDPRGIDINGNQTVYGDIRYDVAKLAHSVLGLYDFILGGHFHYSETDEYNVELQFFIGETTVQIQEYFKNMKFAGYSLEELCVYPILIHLFFSMLPLHDDSPLRQKALLANALRLYVEFKNPNL